MVEKQNKFSSLHYNRVQYKYMRFLHLFDLMPFYLLLEALLIVRTFLLYSRGNVGASLILRHVVALLLSSSVFIKNLMGTLGHIISITPLRLIDYYGSRTEYTKWIYDFFWNRGSFNDWKWIKHLVARRKNFVLRS